MLKHEKRSSINDILSIPAAGPYPQVGMMPSLMPGYASFSPPFLIPTAQHNISTPLINPHGQFTASTTNQQLQYDPTTNQLIPYAPPTNQLAQHAPTTNQVPYYPSYQ